MLLFSAFALFSVTIERVLVFSCVVSKDIERCGVLGIAGCGNEGDVFYTVRET